MIRVLASAGRTLVEWGRQQQQHNDTMIMTIIMIGTMMVITRLIVTMMTIQ